MFGFLRRRRDERDETWAQGPDLLQDAIQAALPKPKKRVHWAETIIQQLNFSKDSSEEEDEEDEDEEDGSEIEEEEKKISDKKCEEVKSEEKTNEERKPSLDKELDVKSLLSKVSDMDRDLNAKTCLIDRLQKELREAYAEAEAARGRLRVMETANVPATPSFTPPPASPERSPSPTPTPSKEPTPQPVVCDEEEDEEDSSEEDDEDEDTDEEEEDEDEEGNRDDEGSEKEDEKSESQCRVEELNRTNAELNRLNSDLNKTNTELSRTNAELRTRVNDLNIRSTTLEKQLAEANERIQQLEEELNRVKEEKEVLEISMVSLQRERDEEIKSIQKAFDETVAEQEIMISKFSQDFEELRTLNATREQKLLEDFEWKLREVEKGCKKRIEQRDKEKDNLIVDVTEKLSAAEDQIKDVPRLKAIESEFEQLRTSNTELKRNLRMTTRKLEEVQVSEKVLQEETTRLRSAVDKEKSYAANLHIVHREELDERERKHNFRLNVQKTSLTMEWEDKLKKEICRIKDELEQRIRDERQAAADTARQLKDKEIRDLRAQWDRKTQALLTQISDLERKLAEKEDEKKEDLENAQTRSDQELFDLRRQLDKLYMSCEERVEKLQEQHDQKLGETEQEWSKRLEAVAAEAEAARQLAKQVREQAASDAQAAIQQLQLHHQRRLEEQFERLVREKEEALRNQESKHKSTVRQLEMEVAALSRCAPPVQVGRSSIDGLPMTQQMQQTPPTPKEPSLDDSQQSPRLSLNTMAVGSFMEDRVALQKMCGAIRVYPQIIQVFPANVVQEVRETPVNDSVEKEDSESDYEEANDDTVMSEAQSISEVTPFSQIKQADEPSEEIKASGEVKVQPDLLNHSPSCIISTSKTSDGLTKVTAPPILTIPENQKKQKKQPTQATQQQQTPQHQNKSKRNRKSRKGRR